MNQPRYSAHSQPLDEATVRLTLFDSDGPLDWRGFLNALGEDVDLADVLCEALAALPFTAFRWETPGLTRDRVDRMFECVAVDDPSLDTRPDPSPFDEHLRGDRSVVRFSNLGGDATLIVPCRRARAEAYGHIAAFVRRAPRAQQRELWRMLARVMQERLGTRPVWLNTAGAGVAWLHLRLDDRPKYYAYGPYRDLVRS